MNLTQHIQEKAYNMRWLAPLVQGDAPVAHFPYRLTPGASATLTACDIPYRHDLNDFPTLAGLENSDPIYIINMPHVPPKQEARPYQKFRRMLVQIPNDAGGERWEDSLRLCRNRVCVVVGVNGPLSLDNRRNRKLARYIRHMPKIPGLNYRAFGRIWVPTWHRLPGHHAETYPKERAFLLVKLLNANAAATIINFNEGSQKLSDALKSQIPYQLIRQMNANHAFTNDFFRMTREMAPNNPIYLLSLDDDTQSMKSLFVGYDQIVRQWLETHDTPPHVISTGYHAAADEKPIYRLGIKLDMKIREAMASVIPDGPYYPEPNVMFLLTEPPNRLNFIGDRNRLESRRAIRNGIRRGTFNPDHMIFRSIPYLVTTVPPGMVTDFNESTDEVSSTKIAQRRVIKALGGLSQTHFFPKEWAGNLYLALPIAMRVTNVTTPLMKLYTAFLPTAMAIAFAKRKRGNYTFKVLREFLNIYDIFAAQQALVANGEIDLAAAEARIPAPYTGFFRIQASIALANRDRLGDLGLDAEWQRKVVACAHASGQAAARFFREEMA